MAKRTAIIDIGSNSARLVIFEKTSRYGFHLMCEQKSKVRIGEGAYEKDGYLQPIGIKRAFLALKSFLHTIKKYKVHKTICVATSALRDAPNGKAFVAWVAKELQLSIRIIDGLQEAKYGAIAAKNLLPIQEGITIDIGGGSSDMALIQNHTIVDTYSLNLGTVRLKELFFDKNSDTVQSNQQAQAYIQEALHALPKQFRHTLAIGIGGTARTLSKALIKRSKHPLDRLHAFSYSVQTHQEYFDNLSRSSTKELKAFGIKKQRYDTIREGTLIFRMILEHIGAKEVISSGVGVREGVFLEQLLKDENLHFPLNLNPSIHSILDRFDPLVDVEKKRKSKHKIASSLYAIFEDEMRGHPSHKKELLWALTLSSIGKTLTIYKSHHHAFYIAMQELHYSVTHQESLLVAMLLRSHGKESILEKPPFEHFKPLLPSSENLLWLTFIYTLSVTLYEASNAATIAFKYENDRLSILSDKPLYLAKEKIESLEKPLDFSIVIEDEDTMPKNTLLGIL